METQLGKHSCLKIQFSSCSTKLANASHVRMKSSPFLRLIRDGFDLILSSFENYKRLILTVSKTPFNMSWSGFLDSDIELPVNKPMIYVARPIWSFLPVTLRTNYPEKKEIGTFNCSSQNDTMPYHGFMCCSNIFVCRSLRSLQAQDDEYEVRPYLT